MDSKLIKIKSILIKFKYIMIFYNNIEKIKSKILNFY